jgi:cytochrome c oxidase assembly factor CtaG
MPSWPAVLSGWSVDPPVVAALGAAVLLWAQGIRRAGGVPRRRSALFLAGVGVVGVALLSPIDRYAADRFSVHMLQHLLLVLVAAPLLVLARPVTLLLRASSPAARRRLVLPVLHSRPLAVLTAPALAWGAFTVVTWVTHHPAVYELTLRNQAAHAVEHLAYLGSALLFWFAVIGADPSPTRTAHPARLLFLFLVMPQMTFLGLAVYSATHVLYPSYGAHPVGVLADQRLAGTLMGVTGMFPVIPAMGAVLLDWLRREELAADRADARRDRARAGLPGGPVTDTHPNRSL